MRVFNSPRPFHDTRDGACFCTSPDLDAAAYITSIDISYDKDLQYYEGLAYAYCMNRSGKVTVNYFLTSAPPSGTDLFGDSNYLNSFTVNVGYYSSSAPVTAGTMTFYACHQRGLSMGCQQSVDGGWLLNASLTYSFAHALDCVSTYPTDNSSRWYFNP